MDVAYTVCMAVGIAVPLLSLVLGNLLEFLDGLFEGASDFLEGLDFDFSIDIGDVSICLIPVSIQSICAGLLFFGAAGKIAFNGENYLVANIVAVLIGYLAAAAVQTLIRKLKKIEHSPSSQDRLLMCETTVTNTIPAGGYGAVSIKTEGGTTLSYPAKARDSSETIRQNTSVHIIYFEKNVAIVIKAGSATKNPTLFN